MLKIGFIKYAIPTGLAILSNQAIVGLAKFAKVGSVGVLELIVPVSVFAGYFIILNRIKSSAKEKPVQQQLPPPNYDKDYEYLNNNQPNYNEQAGWNCDKEFFMHECGVKYESFNNSVKRTEYEFRRRSSTW